MSQTENGSGEWIEALNNIKREETTKPNIMSCIKLDKGHIGLLNETTENTLQNCCSFQWKIPMEDVKRLQSFCKDTTMSKTPTTNGQEDNTLKNHDNRQTLYLHSPTFATIFDKPNTRADWSILATMTKDEKGIEYLSLYLWMVSFHGENDNQNKFGFTFYICNHDFTKGLFRKCSKLRTFGSSPDNQSWGWSHYIPLRRLGNSQNVLNIQAQIVKFERIGPVISIPEAAGDESTTENSSDSEISEGICTPLPSTIDSMKARIADLWKTKEGWDLIINCKDISFMAHKSILMARSTYFVELFNQQHQCQVVDGTERAVYDMYDVKSSLVEGMLEFSYTGKATLFKSFVETAKLCSLASELKMKSLAKEAFLQLTQPSRVKLWTIMLILQHAKYVLDQPTASCFKQLEIFMRENYKSVKKMAGFKKWMSSSENYNIMSCILFNTS